MLTISWHRKKITPNIFMLTFRRRAIKVPIEGSRSPIKNGVIRCFLWVSVPKTDVDWRVEHETEKCICSRLPSLS